MNDFPNLPGPLGQRFRWGWRWRRIWYPLAGLLGGILPRLLDLLLAMSLIGLLAPVLFARALVGIVQAGRVFASVERVGRFRTPFWRHVFAGSAPGAGLAVLFNILKGDLAFAGPRALKPEEAEALPGHAGVRFRARPGLFSPHALRRKTGIAYDDEAELDKDFYYGETARGNAGLVARAAIGSLLAGGGDRSMPRHFTLLGVSIVNTTLREAIDFIVARVRDDASSLVAFVNPDCLNIACKHEEYHGVLERAACVWPDGIGINLGCRMLGLSLRENVNGTDMFPRLCERAVEENLSLYLLGARPGIARKTADTMRARYPGLGIAGTRDGYFRPEEEDSVIETINASGADILLAAFGAPRQELWLARHQARLRPRVLMGVGGLFDFYSGSIPRAPIWMREVGLEWTWRLMQEPGRMWRRYLVGNPLFLYRVYRQKLKETSA
jgi:N-acetylglucosaminyldiphosphoundecaprenol N-acetyl-beta-D-mannosaminyltransferase